MISAKGGALRQRLVPEEQYSKVQVQLPGCCERKCTWGIGTSAMFKAKMFEAAQLQ
jgi:hypothetical protein